MRTKDLASLLGLSTATLRDWTINQYHSYLSPAAQGGTGKVRNFDDQDARIIAFVAAMRADAISHEVILDTLDNYQANGWQDLPPLPVAPPGHGPVTMIPEHSAQAVLQEQRRALMREISIREDQIEDLQDRLATETTAHEATRATLSDIRQQLGQLQGQLQTLDSSMTRERRLLVRVLVAVAVVAAVMLAVVVIIALTGGTL